MKASVAPIIISFLLAIAAVVLTINIPKITGNATDTLLTGVIQKQIYAAVEKSLEDGATMEGVANGIAAQTGKNVQDITLADLINALGAENGDFAENVPQKYRDAVLNMKLYTAPSMDIDAVIRLLIAATILIAISGILNYGQSFLLAGVAQKISYRLRRDIDLKINKLPFKYYDKIKSGEVLSYLTNDVDNISTSLNQSLAQLVTAVTTIIGVLVMMFSISWILTLIALVIMPLSFLLVLTVVKLSQKHFVNQQKKLGEANAHIEEMYGAHQVVQLYNGQQDSKAGFEKLNKELAHAAKRSQFLSGLMQPCMQLIGNLGYVVTCVVGGVLVANGGLGVGNIQSFIQYMRQFNQPIAQFGNIMNTLQLTVASAERVFGFLNAEEEKDSGEGAPESCRGVVEFKNVKFGYSEDKIIIKDFSSRIEAGSKVAIVGPTGAGKTTMVKLLMRFYDLNGGAIYLDGKNVEQYSRDGMRNEFGMVLQDTWLYSASIRENIRYGRLDATDEEVTKAAKIACADHFIRTLEGGYDFVINEEADNISQGQKQLLTIARAVLADPKVLILDEATSSVDTRTELLIQKAMARLMEGRTSFIIAHRLSTIKDADKILVMRDGDIVEQGNHEELMQIDDGFYKKLYNAQFA
ncbi:MAG: ABC transporter ATP-binding protein [Clostridia bacterium]|nr:ABC transporter ATP-binding protein [Clostridia bacterium]